MEKQKTDNEIFKPTRDEDMNSSKQDHEKNVELRKARLRTNVPVQFTNKPGMMIVWFGLRNPSNISTQNADQEFLKIVKTANDTVQECVTTAIEENTANFKYTIDSPHITVTKYPRIANTNSDDIVFTISYHYQHGDTENCPHTNLNTFFQKFENKLLTNTLSCYTISNITLY